MESTIRRSPQKSAEESTEIRIKPRIKPKGDGIPHPVFYRKGLAPSEPLNLRGYSLTEGERVRRIYWRNGSFYARHTSPEDGREHFVKSPDGTPQGAVKWLEEAERKKSIRDSKAFWDATRESLHPERGTWTIGRCIEEYERFAQPHFAALSSKNRKRGGGLKHTLWSIREVFGRPEAASRPVAEAPRILSEWLDGELRREGEMTPTMHSKTSQARCLFSSWALDEYAANGMRVPELRWRRVAPAEYQYELPPQELRDRTIAAGKEEIAKGSDFGIAFLLEFYCAMAAEDAARARWDWLDAGGTVHYHRGKTGKPADPRLPAWAAARWRELEAVARRDAMLPGSTDDARNHWLVTKFAAWVKALGFDRPGGKRGHELRKLMCSIWYTTPGIGAEWTQAWSGDSLAVLQKHYARLLPERAPAAPDV